MSNIYRHYQKNKTTIVLMGFFYLFFTCGIQAQDYERVDAILELYPTQLDNPEQLSAFISRDFTSEEDKVRAIYGWIINNIAYNPEEYKVLDYSYTTIKDRNKKQERFREEIIKRVLVQGDAVCEGYAMLFERLCELQGIQSYLVRGDSKASLADINRPFKATHMWNIVYLDKTPYLFDPTWGAGKYNGSFKKDPSYAFYKTPPKVFLRTHYPVDVEDALLENVPEKDVFLNAPIIVDTNILDAKGIRPGAGTLQSDVAFSLWEFSIPYAKQAVVSYSLNGNQIQTVESFYKEDKLTFTIPSEIGARFLIVYINDATALAYKVN